MRRSAVRSREAETHRAEAAALVDALPDDASSRSGSTPPANLAGAELYLDRFDEAGAHAERAMAVGRATGQTDLVPLCLQFLAWVRMLRGELAEAVRAARRRRRGRRDCRATPRASRVASSTALSLALAAGDLELALSDRRGERRADPRAGPRPRLGRNRAGARRARSSRPATQVAPSMFLSRLRAATSSRSSRAPGGPVARAANPVLARARPPRRGRSALPPCAEASRRDVRAPPGRGDGRSRGRGGRARLVGDPATAAERALASAAAADEVGAPRRSRVVAHARRPRARASRSARARRGRAASRPPRSFTPAARVRYRAAAERELRQLGHRMHRRTPPGKADGVGCRLADGARTSSRPARRRPQTNPEIAADALPQPQDGRDAHAQHLPQARCLLARRGRARRRALRGQECVSWTPRASTPAADEAHMTSTARQRS